MILRMHVTNFIQSHANFLVLQIGSYAATAQSVVGNVAAASTFATMQSAGAGGLGAGIVNAAAQVGGALTSAGSLGLAWLQRNTTA